jgi:hypothetical protein
MKRLLSILVAALAAAFSFAATAQTCGNTVKVLFIIESTAASYISSTMGQSTTAFVATQVSRTNTILSNTNTGMQIASVGTTLGGLCCGGKTALRDTVDLPASGQTPIIGAVNWAKSQRAIAEAREAAGADVVVLVTNYVPDATGVAGSRCNRPGSPPPTAQNAVVGINAWAIGQGNEALAQQLARTMCMDESEGVTVATGTSASNCAIYFTQEYPRDGTGVSKVIGVPGQTGTACSRTAAWSPRPCSPGCPAHAAAPSAAAARSASIRESIRARQVGRGTASPSPAAGRALAPRTAHRRTAPERTFTPSSCRPAPARPQDRASPAPRCSRSPISPAAQG